MNQNGSEPVGEVDENDLFYFGVIHNGVVIGGAG